MTLKIASAAVILTALSLAVAQAADKRHGQRVFAVCAPCHVVDSDINKLGPSLKGVVGRQARSVAGYRYSPAMQAAGSGGLFWTENTLSEFLYSPKSKVPGTSMRFWGLWTDAEIKDLIAYLADHP